MSGRASKKRAEADAEPGSTTHLRRQSEVPRSNWRKKVEESGLTFAELEGVYWLDAKPYLDWYMKLNNVPSPQFSTWLERVLAEHAPVA